ncbi:diguanylate cyclase [Inhella sp.]|uniref:diguanylate cyclase n=1 Tax=Inhella sp. TaxID=1921806 RepID=UPI0035B13D78
MGNLVDQLADATGLRNLDQLDLSLVGLLCETLPLRRASVLASFSDGEAKRWYLRASQRPGESLPHSDALTVRMDELPLREEQALLARCADEQRMCCQALPDGGVHTALPLFDDAGMEGVLELESDAPLEGTQMRLLGSILRFYGNFRCLVFDNERDQLTGLYNRKPFDDHFGRAQELVAKGGSWLAVLDIDHFKRVNDQYGHLVGDEVLLLIGRLLRGSFRFSDKAFRFGGEEFLLLLRGTDETDAQRIVDSFRIKVAQQEFPQVGRITVSIGFTLLLGDDTPHSALERADRAVYAAKQAGRDRALGFEQLVRDGQLEPQQSVGSVDFF